MAHPPVFAAAVEVEGRRLRLAAFVPPETGIFTGPSINELLLWRADLDDGSATYMGSAPKGAGVEYAIDDGTFLLNYLPTGNPGAHTGGVFHYQLLESR